MIYCFHDVIYTGVLRCYAQCVCFENIACLLSGKTTAFDVV